MSRGPLESETCRERILPALAAAGWVGDLAPVEQYRITDGRIVPTQRGHGRGEQLRADYVLEYRPGVPVAVVEAKRSRRDAADGFQQAKRYAERLDVPLAYGSNGRRTIENDALTGRETEPAAFPTPERAWAVYRAWKGLDEPSASLVATPFDRTLTTPTGVKEPRYYQRVAVNRAVGAIAGGRRRSLLVLATGTGKTFVALQIVAKLTRGGWTASRNRNPRVLYLADRNILVDQPIAREFKPVFGDAVARIGPGVGFAREIYFGLYQSLVGAADEPSRYEDFPPDFFDLVIVDECHRGSAGANSAWRAVLEHFAPAAQLGLTATPVRKEDADTYEYFGDPIYEYSLASGIDDGFLAPYRVRRVVLSSDAFGFAPSPGQLDMFGAGIPQGLYKTGQFERTVSLLTRTEAAARHLTDHLASTGPMAKTIVFCVNSEHAHQMRQALHNLNPELVGRHPNYVVRIVSDEGTVGQEHLGDFADVASAAPVIATTSQLLSTGVDIPTVRNIVLFRTIGSMALFKQIIGRGTRLFPDEDKLSFEIIDYAQATSLFADREFDGPPERVTEEEIDDAGKVVEAPAVEEPEPDPRESGNGPEPADLDDRPGRKLYVDDEPVWVVAEGVYVLDPASGRPRLREYREHAADSVRALCRDPADLGGRWREDRAALLDALAGRGVSVADLSEQTGIRDADPLDILVHIAWNDPLATRHDKARRVLAEHRAFFERFRPDAREILRELLDRYAEHGLDELENLRTLELPPISAHGTPTEIAERFGGAEALRRAHEELVGLLYAA